MAKLSRTDGEIVPAAEKGRKLLRLQVDAPLLRRMQHHCIDRDLRIGEVIAAAIEAYLGKVEHELGQSKTRRDNIR